MAWWNPFSWFSSVRDALGGKKTYFVAVVGITVFVLGRCGVIPPEIENAVLKLLGLTGLMTVRAGIARNNH